MGALHATFRPAARPVGPALLAGAAAGGLLGALLDLPALLFALLGAAAAFVAVAARHAAGLRAVATADGLHVAGPRDHPAVGLEARWEELRLGFGFAVRADGGAQRYAIVADGRGRSFAFASLGGGPPCAQPVTGADGRPVPVVDLGAEAAVLLGVAVQRAPAWQALPEQLRAPPPPPGEATAAAESAAAVVPPPPRERSARLGLLGLVAKLGTKLAGAAGKAGGAALKAAKGTHLGWAAASAATYTVVFSWKFALAIMVQLFVHEYGHVHAMRRTGMKVRGMYFIPFLGALAVTEDEFTSRRQQAYVALNGPLWGSALALLPAAAYAAGGDPQWAAVASWWAIINLFNLLPIAPLDGGRVMQAFAFSYSSTLGLAVSVAGLVGAVALGTALGFSLIWLVAALGAVELFSEAQARVAARALRLLPEPARFGPTHWLALHAAVGPPPGGPADLALLRGIDRARRAARAEPLRGAEMVRWGLAYAGLAAALVLLVFALRHLPGADLAAGILE